MVTEAITERERAASFPRPSARGASLSVSGVVLVTLGAAVWTTATGALAAWRHAQFLSHRADLGNIVQAVWSTAHGRVLQMTDPVTGDQIARLAGHVDPILVLYTPLWWLHPRPETLLVAQAAALASGIYPVVRLGLKYTGSRLAAGMLGAWYLTIPWVVWLTLNELNPVSLALPLLLYAIWFLDEHRLGLFAVFAGLAMLTGELIGVTVAALGVWYALRHRRAVEGAVIAAVGSAWTLICLTLVIPAFNSGRPSRHYEHFESVGGSPLGLLRTLFADPGTVVAQMTSGGDVQYVLWLILPTVLLFLGRPLLALVAVPQLAVNLLSEFPATVSPLYHYAAPVLAALVAASIMGIGRLPPRLHVVGAGAALFVAVVLLGSIPPRPGQEAYLFPSLETPARSAAMRRAVDLLPSEASLMVTNRLGAHLSARRVIHVFPQGTGSDWAALDTQDPSSSFADPAGRVVFRRLLERLDGSGRWQLVFESEGVRVYRKRT